MIIGGVEGVSFVDYPSKISTVFFLRMCNFDCFYCHNRSLLTRGESILFLDQVEPYLRERAHLIDAVVVSGGEPTLYDDLPAIFEIAKSLNLSTKLDTNGSHPKMIHSLLDANLVDYVALDIKAPKEKYNKVARYYGKVIYETLTSLERRYKNNKTFTYEIRTTVAPSLTEEDLLEIATTVAKVPLWSLQEYRVPLLYNKGDETLIHTPPLKKQHLEKILHRLQEIQPNVRIV